jgi:hypothetical protein
MFEFFEWRVANNLDGIALPIAVESTISGNIKRFIFKKTSMIQVVPMCLIMSSIFMWRNVENVSNEGSNDQNIHRELFLLF